MNAFSIRLERFRSELKWLFCELYPGSTGEFQRLAEMMQKAYTARPARLRERDSLLMNNPNWYRMASMEEKFIENGVSTAAFALKETPDTAEKFFEAAERLLKLSEEDLDLIEVTGVEEIFIIPNTPWQHRQHTHDFTRILRILNDIVSPGVLLVLEMRTLREEVNTFFGQQEHPEFHLVGDRSFIPALWNTVATNDTRLLSEEIRKHSQQPKFHVYTRAVNDPEGFLWDLDYGYLDVLKMQKDAHCKYLNDFYTKRRRGEKTRAKALKNEAGEVVGIQGGTERLLREDRTMYELILATLYSLSGIPLLKERKAEKQKEDAFGGLKLPKLLKLRKEYHVFDSDADVWTMDTDNNAILGVGRYKEGQKFYGFYNYSNEPQIFTLRDPGSYENLLNGKKLDVNGLVRLPAHGYAWLFRENG